MRYVLSLLALVLSGLCFVLAVAGGVLSIWTVGPNADRFGETGLLVAAIGVFLGIVSAALTDGE